MPIVRAHFEPYKQAYLEDGLCNKGVLLAEVLLGGNKAAIVATTHMQAPTGGYRIKASNARSTQWDEEWVLEETDRSNLKNKLLDSRIVLTPALTMLNYGSLGVRVNFCLG